MTKKHTMRLSIAIAIVLAILLGLISIMTLTVSLDVANADYSTIQVVESGSPTDYNVGDPILAHYCGAPIDLTFTVDLTQADTAIYFERDEDTPGEQLNSAPTNVGTYYVSLYYNQDLLAELVKIEVLPKEVTVHIYHKNTTTPISSTNEDYTLTGMSFDVELDSADNEGGKLSASGIESWEWENYDGSITDSVCPVVFNAGTYTNPKFNLASSDQNLDVNNYKGVWSGTSFTVNRIDPSSLWSITPIGEWQFGEQVEHFTDKMEMKFADDFEALQELPGGAFDYNELQQATFAYTMNDGYDYCDETQFSQWVTPGTYTAKATTESTFTNYVTDNSTFFAGNITISKAKVYVEKPSYVYDGNEKTPVPTFHLYSANGPVTTTHLGISEDVVELNGTPTARYEASEDSVNAYLYTFDVIIPNNQTSLNGHLSTDRNKQDLFELIDENGSVDLDSAATYSWEILRATVTINIGDLSKTYDKTSITAPTIANGKITLENRPNGTNAENDAYFEVSTGVLNSVSYALKGNATSIEDVNLEWGTDAPINAGTYYARVSMTAYKNYNASTGYVEFTIEKKSLGMVSVFQNTSSTYGDGITYFNRSVYTTGLEVGDENVEPIDERWYYSEKNPSFEIYPYNESNPNWIALSSYAFNRYSDVGEYWIFYVAEYENYVTLMNSKTHTINAATITDVSIAQNIEGSNALVYNGLAQTPILDKSATTVNGVEYVFKYCKTSNGEFTTTVPTFTNASNSHTIYYKVEADNHTTYSASFDIVINKASLTITAEDKETTYGSAAPAFTYTTLGFVNSETIAVLGGSIAYDCDYYIENELKRNVGEYDICPKGFTSDNYDIAYINGTLTVGQKTLTITFDRNRVFNGQNQKPNVTSIEGTVYEDEIGVGFIGGNTIEVGAWDNLITFELTGDKKDNYTCESFKTSLTIAAKPVNIIWTGLDNTTYTGSEKTVTAAVDPASICEGYNVAVKTTINNAKTDAGDYTAEVTELDNANYTLEGATHVSYVWEITLANITNYSATQDVVLTYNGEPQVGHFATSATTVNNQVVTFWYCTEIDGDYKETVPAFTTAGSHKVYVKMTAPNHKPTGAVIETSITIEKADKDMSDVSFFGDYNPYNGTVKTLEISGNLPSGVSVAYYVTDKDHNTTNTVFEGQKYFGTYYVEARFTVDDTDNYNVPDSMYAVLDIQKRTLVISWTNTNPVYNGQNQKPVANITNKQDGNDDVSVAISSGVTILASDEGCTWTISNMVLSGEQADSYQLDEEEQVHFTIQKKEVTLIWSNTELIYNGESQKPTAVVNPESICEGDSVSVTNVIGQQILANAATEYPTYNAEAQGLDNSNYKLPTGATLTQEYVINPAEVGLDWESSQTLTLTYNGSAQKPIVWPTGTFGNDICDFTVTGEQVNVGNYTATVTAVSNKNYVLPENGLTHEFTIVAAEIGIEWSNIVEFTYDKTTHKPTATATGLIGSDVCDITVTGEQTNVGNYTATAESLSNANYKLPTSGLTQAYTITPKKVTLAWDNDSFVYDGEEHSVYATVSGTINDEVVSVTAYYGSKDCIDANSGSTYNTTATTLSNSNYTLNGVENVTKTWTITPKKVTLAWDNDSFVYDGIAHSVYATVSGTVKDDVVSVTEYSGSVDCINVPDDSYNTTAIALSNSNYTLDGVENVTKTWTITPKAITVSYNSTHKEVTYGDEEAFIAVGIDMEKNNYYLVAELCGGDSIYSVVNITMVDNNNDPADIDSETPAGRYNLVVTEAGNENYDVNVDLGDEAYLLVKKATLTININPIENIIFGNSITVPTLNNGFTVTGWKNDDTDALIGVENVSVQWVNKGDYNTLEEMLDDPNFNAYTDVLDVQPTAYGTYYLIVAIGGLDNYESGTYAYTSYRITKAYYDMSDVAFENINVTYDGTAKTATISGKLPDGVVVAYTTNTLTNAGTITATAIFTGDAENYEPIDDMTCTITINPKSITVTAEDKESVYGDALVALTATAPGIVEGDSANDVYTLEKAAGTNAGTYAITVVPANNANYNVTVVNATYTITAKAITVTAVNKTSVYGQDIVALTATDTGIVVGDSASDVYTLSKAAGVNAGTYAITVTAINANYNVTVVNATYTITAKAITVTAENKTSVYGKDIVALTATLSENALVGEDTAASVYTLNTTATKTSKPGIYPINVVVANNANYDVTATNAEYTITEAAPVVNEAGVKEYNKEITVEEAVKGVSVTDLFKNAKNDTAETKEVVAKVGNASIAFNAAAIAAIGAADNISLKVDIVEGENIGEDAPKGAVMVFNISLEGATFEEGTAVVEVPFDGKVPTGKEAKVFYVDENGKRTAMKTTYVDGVLAFETNHFSQYIVTYELTTATIAGIIVACVVVVAVIIVAIILVLKKKKGNGGKKAEEKKAEDKVDVEETKVEEAAPASEEAPKDAE